MRPFKLAGRSNPTGPSRNSYSHDTGLGRPTRSVSIWLIFLISLCGIVGVGYLKVELGKRSASLAFQTPNQPDRSAKPTPSSLDTPSKLRPETQLELQIENWGQANSSQQWGIVVQQLSTADAIVNYRAESTFHPAGLETILMDQALIDGYNYTTWSQPLGSTSSSISECVNKMIKDSDQTCTTAISNLVGSKNINYQLKKTGATKTDLASLNSKWHTTAGDVNQYLNKFYLSSKNSDAKNFILNLMKQQTNRSGIADGSPNCKVFDKAGDYNGYRNDAAIVVCPKVTYSLTILSQGGSYSQIAELAKLVNKFFTY